MLPLLRCSLATLILLQSFSCSTNVNTEDDSIQKSGREIDLSKRYGIKQENGNYLDKNDIPINYFYKGQRSAADPPFMADFEDPSNIKFGSLSNEQANYVVGLSVEFANSMFEFLPIEIGDSIIDASYTIKNNFSAIFSVNYNSEFSDDYLLISPRLFRIDLVNKYGRFYRLYWINNDEEEIDKTEGIFALVPNSFEEEYNAAWLSFYREGGGISNFQRHSTKEEIVNDSPNEIWEKLANTSDKKGYHYMLTVKGNSGSVIRRDSRFMVFGIVQ